MDFVFATLTYILILLPQVNAITNTKANTNYSTKMCTSNLIVISPSENGHFSTEKSDHKDTLGPYN